MLFLSDEQKIWFRKFTRYSHPNKKGTKAESKLNSPEPCKYSKVFFILIFSDKTVILLEKALIVADCWRSKRTKNIITVIDSIGFQPIAAGDVSI